jgi:t-SNARE complex subunit (syntaxin)
VSICQTIYLTLLILAMSLDRLSELVPVPPSQEQTDQPFGALCAPSHFLPIISTWPDGVLNECLALKRSPRELANLVHKHTTTQCPAELLIPAIRMLKRTRFDAHIDVIKRSVDLLIQCTCQMHTSTDYDKVMQAGSDLIPNIKTLLVTVKEALPDPTLSPAERQYHTDSVHNISLLSHKALDEFYQTVHNRHRRHLRLLNPTLEDAQIDDLIERGEAGTVFQKQLMSHQPSENLSGVIEQITTRYDAIQQLERDVREILELFQDLNTLVDLQQESLNVIDHHIQKAVHHVYDAEGQLEEAESYSQRVRRMRCCCLMLTLLFCGGIAALIVVKTT